MKTKVPVVKVETEQEKKARETVEAIAGTLISLSDSVSVLMRGPLNRKALIVLLAASSGVNKGTIDTVLDSIESLKKDWTK